MSNPKGIENPKETENLEIVIERHEKVIEKLEIERINKKRTKRTRNNKKRIRRIRNRKNK